MATGISMSDYLANKVGDLVFREVSFAAPAALWLALFTSATVLGGTGGGTEVSTGGTGYSRKQIPEPRSAQFTAFASGQTSNINVIDFGTATTAWGSLQYAAFFDASTSGNMIFYGVLTGAPRVVNAGQPVKFPVGSLIIAFD